MPEYFTRREAAAYLRFSLKTLERRVSAGAIPVLRVGGLTRFARADLDAYMDSCRVRVGGVA